MDRRFAARAFSVLLLAAAAVVWVVFDKPAAAMGLAAMAIASWITMATRDVPADLAGAMALSQSATLAQLVRDLRLEGRGVHVPCADGRLRLFIPASPSAAKPIPRLLDEGVIAEGAAAIGLALQPPGQALYDAWVAREGQPPQGRGAEEAADQVRRALPALGLGARVKVSRAVSAGGGAAGRIRVEYEPAWTRGACAATRRDGSAAQAGCPCCSLIAMLVAKSVGAPMRFEATNEAGAAVRLDLEEVRADGGDATSAASVSRSPNAVVAPDPHGVSP